MPRRRGGGQPGRPSSNQEVRIIGGEWRRRRISFPDLPGLRPSSDRVRETLFNWLQTEVAGARVLDLFAGSGCLGLEALSRGAAELQLVDASGPVCSALRAACQELQAGNAAVSREDALTFLHRESPSRYDLVFVDPPFDSGLLEASLAALDASGKLAGEAWIYVEHGAEVAPRVPAGWQLHRQLEAGHVVAALWRSR